MKDKMEANIDRNNRNNSNANKNSIKKRKIDPKTQQLLDSSRKLGRRLISMDMSSEEKDKKRRGKRNMNVQL